MAAGSKGGAITQASIVETVFEQVRCVAPADLVADLTLDTPLLEVGLDSLAQMDVVNRIESIFGVRFAEESLYDLETCRDLVVLIEDTLARANGRAGVRRESERVVEQVVPQAAAAFETASAGDVSSFPECLRFRQRLHDSAAAGLRNPFFRVSEGMRGATTTIAGQPVVNFTSFDYLGMARHPQVADAAKNAIDQFGTSASASRLVGGNSTLLEDLDDELARFLGAEAVAVFPSGYGTNASLFGHLFGQDDLILYDELAHNSIVQGSLLSPRGAVHFRTMMRITSTSC